MQKLDTRVEIVPIGLDILFQANVSSTLLDILFLLFGSSFSFVLPVSYFGFINLDFTLVELT